LEARLELKNAENAISIAVLPCLLHGLTHEFERYVIGIEGEEGIKFDLDRWWLMTVEVVGAMPSEHSDAGMLTLRESLAP
jgi:hypothetical protein